MEVNWLKVGCVVLPPLSLAEGSICGGGLDSQDSGVGEGAEDGRWGAIERTRAYGFGYLLGCGVTVVGRAVVLQSHVVECAERFVLEDGKVEFPIILANVNNVDRELEAFGDESSEERVARRAEARGTAETGSDVLSDGRSDCVVQSEGFVKVLHFSFFSCVCVFYLFFFLFFLFVLGVCATEWEGAKVQGGDFPMSRPALLLTSSQHSEKDPEY